MFIEGIMGIPGNTLSPALQGVIGNVDNHPANNISDMPLESPADGTSFKPNHYTTGVRVNQGGYS